MVRTQISLTQQQYDGLQALARTRHRAMAALLREAVDDLLREAEREALWDEATAALGSFSSGRHDVSTNHDAYLDEAFGS